MRLLRSRGTPIALGGEATAVPVWTAEVPGTESHGPRISPETSSLYFGDGMGRFFSTIRFRRYDLGTGAELAKFKSYNSVRCTWFDQTRNNIVIALDNRIVRLDALSLEELGRWDRRIPAYPDSIDVCDEVAVVANWVKPSLGLVDLRNGRVRHRPTGPLPMVVGGYKKPLLLERYDGGLRSVDTDTGELKLITETPPCHDGQMGKDGRSIWLTVGSPARVGKVAHDARMRPGVREIARYALDGSEPEEYQLPVAVDRIDVGETQLWLRHGPGDSEREPGSARGESYLLTVPLPVASGPARILRLPEPERIVAVHPDARLALIEVPDWTERKSSTFKLIRLQD